MAVPTYTEGRRRGSAKANGQDRRYCCGFVLIGLAVGLFIWAGYELSLIYTDYYDLTARETLQPILGVALLIAATMALAERALMRSSKRRRRGWR
jgi:hypothetical protein